MARDYRYLFSWIWSGKLEFVAHHSKAPANQVVDTIAGELDVLGADVRILGNTVQYETALFTLQSTGNPLVVFQSGSLSIGQDSGCVRICLRYTSVRILLPGLIAIAVVAYLIGVTCAVLAVAEICIVGFARWSAAVRFKQAIRTALLR